MLPARDRQTGRRADRRTDADSLLVAAAAPSASPCCCCFSCAFSHSCCYCSLPAAAPPAARMSPPAASASSAAPPPSPCQSALLWQRQNYLLSCSSLARSALPLSTLAAIVHTGIGQRDRLLASCGSGNLICCPSYCKLRCPFLCHNSCNSPPPHTTALSAPLSPLLPN